MRPGRYTKFEGCLDKLSRREVHVLNRTWPAFLLCGFAGLALAALLAAALASRTGLAVWVLAVTAPAAILAFLTLAMANKVFTGKERLVYYHHEVAVMLASAFVIEAMRRPVLPYLDVTILGVGLILACGRVGCLTAGCCHGKPHGWGVRYGEDHVNAGFAPELAGVRLFPVQLVEAALALCVVGVGAALVLGGSPPGTALSWYVIAYGLGRFCFEFMRGDAERPYYLGFSQPQWLSAVLMALVVCGELQGALPRQPWHAVATGLLLISMGAIAIRRRLQGTPKYSLLHARHIREVARAVAGARRRATEPGVAFKDEAVHGGVPVGCTSLGIQISTGTLNRGGECIRHYSFSRLRPALTEETAAVLAKLTLRLTRPCGSYELVGGSHGMFHLLVRHASLDDEPPRRGEPGEKSAGSFAARGAVVNDV